MKYLVLLGLVALASCANYSSTVHEGDEEFEPAVHYLNKALANLAATKEGPFFSLVKAYSVTISFPNGYPTVNADLKDQENKVQRCDVTIFKALEVEDFTTEYKVTFDCQNYQSTRFVTEKN